MREKSLRLSLIEAFLCSLMVGAGETYLPAYSLSIGMGEIFAGILATMPIVSGAFLQLITPRGLQRVQSHKHWVVASSLLQAFTFIPLIYYSATRAPNFWMLFGILTLYWGSGFSSGLGWNYWMGRLVHVNEGPRFFSKRARVSQIGTLVGLIGGGVALHNKVEIGPFSSVFTILFIIAGSSRLFSSFVLSSQYFDPQWTKEPKLGFRDSWKVFWANKPKRQFFFFLAPFQAAIFISSPFVTPYFLAQVKLDYGSYMGAIGLLFVGKILALTLIDKFRGQASGFSLLLFGAGAIVPLPALWIISKHTYFIFGLQFLNGLAWAFVEVGLSLIFFADIKQEEKVPVLTVYNLLNSLAIILGTIVGAKILFFFGQTIGSYSAVFLLGSLARGLGFIPLYRYMKGKLLVNPQAPIQEEFEKAS
ncbi:MAG: MFS transporter [Bdellovibrio sp.]